jgi:hypothetical protein
MSENVSLLLDCSRGIYIPQHFVEYYDMDQYDGVDPEDVKILKSGPDHEWYWEAWDNMLNNVTYNHDGKVYALYQDGDLYAVAYDSMSDEEYEEFFGTERIF